MGAGKRFSVVHTRPDLSRGQPSFLYNGYKVSIAGVKRPGRGVDYLPHFNAEVVAWMELLFCFSIVFHCHVMGRHIYFRFSVIYDYW